MNRQTRIGHGPWISRGAVTIEQAAKEAARFLCLDITTVEVRDEDNPSHVYRVRVDREVRYVASGLRGASS